MRNEYTYTTMRVRFANLCKEAGWQTYRIAVGPTLIGALSLEKCFGGGYKVVQVTSTTGGEKDVMFARNGRELQAWIDGCHWVLSGHGKR